jgi:hypothetical protein
MVWVLAAWLLPAVLFLFVVLVLALRQQVTALRRRQAVQDVGDELGPRQQ